MQPPHQFFHWRLFQRRSLQCTDSCRHLPALCCVSDSTDYLRNLQLELRLWAIDNLAGVNLWIEENNCMWLENCFYLLSGRHVVNLINLNCNNLKECPLFWCALTFADASKLLVCSGQDGRQPFPAPKHINQVPKKLVRTYIWWVYQSKTMLHRRPCRC